MFLKKALYMLVCLMGIFASSKAQNVVFKFNNGNPDATFTITELQNFTFSGGTTTLVVKRTNGTTVNYPISSIVNYRYTATTTSVRDLNVITAAEVHMYPNPFRSTVHIKYALASTETVSVEILDMSGRIVKKWSAEKKKAGNHEIIWQPGDSNGRSVQPGAYIFQIKTSKGNISRMMVME